MAVTDTYDVNISGGGVGASDAQGAFEDFVTALRALTPGYGVAAWQAGHAYSLNDLVHPVTSNGHFYKATTAGTSAGSEPVYPTNGGTVTNGVALIWTDQGLIGTAPNGTFRHVEGTAEAAEDVA